MIRSILAAIALCLPMAVSAADHAEREAAAAVPATVVVAFDRESITPVIVEGTRNRESGEAVEVNDPVRIASISKLIMALATLRLVDQDVVDLDTDVSEYLGWQLRSPHHPDAIVTLAQLLSHRSGLRDNAGYIIPLGESLEAKLADPEAWYADAPPGEAPFQYANLGSPVVATVLEAASGIRYDHILEREIFLPLGIADACVNWVGCSDETVGRAVALYRDTGEPARDWPGDLPPNCSFPVAEGVECTLAGYVPGTNASVFSPQGGVRIGMMDLAKIGQAVAQAPDSDLLTRASWDRLTESLQANEVSEQPFFCMYGFSIQMLQASGPGCVDRLFDDAWFHVGHAGEAYGLRSGLWFDIGLRGFVYFTTEVPPRQVAEGEGGFGPTEIALMARATALRAQQESE